MQKVEFLKSKSLYFSLTLQTVYFGTLPPFLHEYSKLREGWDF